MEHAEVEKKLTRKKQNLEKKRKNLKKSESDPIREAHNSFAPPSSLVQEDKKASSDEDAFHFVSYLPFGKEEEEQRERER